MISTHKITFVMCVCVGGGGECVCVCVSIISLHEAHICVATQRNMVSHRGHNCISSALTILDSALTSYLN